jgi:hypothetical protein
MQRPSWVKPPTTHEANTSSSIVVAFEDPTGHISQSLINSKYLYAFGICATVKPWIQRPSSQDRTHKRDSRETQSTLTTTSLNVPTHHTPTPTHNLLRNSPGPPTGPLNTRSGKPTPPPALADSQPDPPPAQPTTQKHIDNYFTKSRERDVRKRTTPAVIHSPTHHPPHHSSPQLAGPTTGPLKKQREGRKT